MTQMASQVRSALRGGVSRVGGGGTSYHDGISYNAETGKVVLKAPGQAPQIVDFTTAFPFTSGNQSMYRGPNGLLVQSVTNQPRVEWESRTVGTNLITQSEAIDDAAWVRSNSSVEANVALAPDGLLTADKVVENAAAGLPHFVQNTAVIYIAGLSYTLSAYVKAAGRDFCSIRLGALAFGTETGIYFNMRTGAVGTLLNSPTSTTVQDVGNGWYRISFTKTATVTSGAGVNIYIANADGNSSYNGDGTSGFLLWGVQVEQADAPSVYTRTTTTVPAYTNTPPVCLGLLTEWAGTNLAIQSEDWTTSHSGAGILAITPNAIASPTGAVTADKITEDTGAAQHRIRDTTETTIVSGGTYAHSCFFKAGERSKCSLRITENTFAASCEAHFDLATGVVSNVSNVGSASGARGYMIPYPNGWWRCVLVGALNGGFVLARFIQEINDAAGNFTYTGDGVSGLYVWGEQIEQGFFATSYIPTTTGAVTRQEDVASRTLGSEYVAGANTVIVKGRNSFGQAASLQAYWYMYNGADIVFVGRAGVSDLPRFNAFTAGAPQGPADGGTIVNGSPFKSASTWQASNDMAHSYNGGATATDTVATIVSMTGLYLGVPGAAQNGHLLTFDLYNFRTPNERLPLLSAL